jgi:UDP-N-acetylmuramoyl-tripeptide--D-alanyl-D-alanine ligase
VEDSLSALQELAKFHRYLNLPIALTGSNGKQRLRVDSCRSFKKYRTKATVGNLNNHIGVPLTLLSAETEIGLLKWA